MDITAEHLAYALAKCRRTGQSAWIACCPAHTEKTPSFAIKEAADGKILLHCFGGCSQSEVISALKRRGLWPEKRVSCQNSKPFFSESELLQFWLFLNIFDNSHNRPDLGKPTETDRLRAHKIRNILSIYGFGISRAIRAVENLNVKR